MSDRPAAPEARDLPLSDDDRAHVVGLLEEAVGRGLIDTAEFDRRSGAAVAATTRREIHPVLADLPLTHPDRARAATAAQARADARDGRGGSGTEGTVVLRPSMGSVTRSGAWAVPRRIEIDGWLGSVELDLTRAVIDHDVVEIDVDLTLGSVELRLPAGASASLDGVTATAGSVEDHRRDREGPGAPHVVVTGRVTLGSVEVRGPRRTPW